MSDHRKSLSIIARRPVAACMLLCAIWLVVLVLLLFVREAPASDQWAKFQDLKLSEVGDFFAGTFSPLVFALLLVTLIVQHSELSEAQRQFKIERDEASRAEEDQKKRLENAARLRLPRALLRLSRHWDNCFQMWSAGTISTVPPVPDEPLNELVSSAADIPDPSFESLQVLISKVQIFESRISHAKKQTENPSSHAENLKIMIYDLCELDYLTARLFTYSRFQQQNIPYVEPTYEQLFEKARVAFEDVNGQLNEGVEARVKDALDSVGWLQDAA